MFLHRSPTDAPATAAEPPRRAGKGCSRSPQRPEFVMLPDQTLISTSTPEGSSSFINASIVLGVDE